MTESLFHNECHSFNFGKDLNINMHRTITEKTSFTNKTSEGWEDGKALCLILKTMKCFPCKRVDPSLILKGCTQRQERTDSRGCPPPPPRIGCGGVCL